MEAMNRDKTTFGLIGYPVSRSFSRPYFTEFFLKNGLADSHQYVNFEMEQFEGFGSIREQFPKLRGINVTSPHKQAVIPFLDELHPSAKRIGAVNCIRFNHNGTTTGFNTDMLGFKSDLLEKLNSAKQQGIKQGHTSERKYLLKQLQTSSRALVLGTGGASLAVLEALRLLQIEVTKVSRTAAPDRITYDDITPELIRDHLLIVNTTPLGMYNRPDTYPALPYSAITDHHFTYDLVYNPAETTFTKRCSAMGASTANGLGMLYGQAEEGWAIWSAEV